MKTIYKDEIKGNHDKKKRVKCICTLLSLLGLDFCGMGNFQRMKIKKNKPKRSHLWKEPQCDLKLIKTDRPAEQLYRKNVQGL